MIEPPAPRKRFPLTLADTAPPVRRLVTGEAARGRPLVAAPTAPVSPEGQRTADSSGHGLLRPQAALSDAARDGQRASRPAGLGLDSDGVRVRMVARLRADPRLRPEVLAAMAAVPRHRFVDPALAAQAYEDTSLPIGLGQTISKPSVVARMLSLLLDAPGRLEGGRGAAGLGRVLEIGTGCGYQAAVLVGLARSVVSVERLRDLYDRARQNLAADRPDHLQLVYADGRHGHPPRAPYDSIIAAAGGDDLPSAWLDQLGAGGRLVAPVADPRTGGQALLVVDRRDDGRLYPTWLEAVHFVPLESGTLLSGQVRHAAD